MSIQLLVHKQHEENSLILRAFANVTKSGPATKGKLESRFKLLEERWNGMVARHVQIEELRKKDNTQEDLEYFKNNLYAEYEESFADERAKFLDAATALEDKENVAPAANGAFGGDPRAINHSSQRLPPIDIPKFSGKYSDWASFKDIFQAVVGKHQGLTNAQRLAHLKSSLSGDAAACIKNIAITNENYARACARLIEHFENKRSLVHSALLELFQVESLTEESASGLRALRDSTVDVIETLESLERPVEHWDDILAHLTVQRLDATTRRDWQTSLGESKEPPTFKALDTFLQTRIRALELSETPTPEKSEKSTNHSGQSNNSSKGKSTGSFPRVTAHATAQPPAIKSNISKCAYCKNTHNLASCSTFRSLDSEQQRSFVKDNKVCFNCLGGHFLRDCRSTQNCRVCNGRHHTLLHPTHDMSKSQPSNAMQKSSSSHQILSSPDEKVTSLNVNMGSQKTILLATAKVVVSTASGRHATVRVLIDPCSEATFISESLAQRLKVQRQAAFVPVTGVGGVQCNTVRTKASVTLASHFGGEATWTINSLILPHLTDYITSLHDSNADLSFVKGLCLADPVPDSKATIEMIIGADFFPLLIEEGLRKSADQSLIAQASALGWIITGSTAAINKSKAVTSHRIQVDQDLSNILEKFWLQEEVKTSDLSSLTKDEIECEKHFVNTHTRNDEGRYVLKLPFKDNLSELGNSYPVASAMLQRMERRFTTTPQFHEEYKKFMGEYSSLNHMRKLERDSEECRPDKGFTVPHHGIYKTNGDKSKLRVVFNGSVKFNDGLAINDCLHVGPKLQTDIFDILLRWRMFRYVFSTDIEKMFRQILIAEEDQIYQKILWPSLLDNSIDTHALTTVTYGFTSSPYQAIRTLRQLAVDEGEKFPKAASLLLNNSYVDDILGGAHSLEETKSLQQELISLLMAGGFPLSKWTANHPELLAALAPEKIAPSLSRSWFQSESLQMLGVFWEPTSDCFLFQLAHEISVDNVTKRKALSFVGRLYDPVGWIAPITINFKIFLQSLWHAQIQWDEPLSSHLKLRWSLCLNQLTNLSSFQIPRWCPFNENSREIHGFADASERAYAAVVYLRSIDSSGKVTCCLLASKTKVAPLKQQSLPRLELSAALLLCLLVKRIQETLNIHNIPIHLWSDSTITLSWIRGRAIRWKTYVANRVSQIQQMFPNAYWHHVSGKENPADLGSRGVSCDELIESSLWGQGPPFLQYSHAVFDDNVLLLSEEDCPDHRPISCVLVERAPEEGDVLLRFSSFNRLLRVSARFLRFIANIRWRIANKPQAKPVRKKVQELTPADLDQSLKFWVKFIQTKYFSNEIKRLMQNLPISKNHQMIRLNPFVDFEGLMRVGGRLQHSLLHPDEIHPLILPPQSHLSIIIVRDAHEKMLHGGTQLTLNYIRQRFWIVNGRKLVKFLNKRCIKCRRHSASAETQLMGSLPSCRAQQCKKAFYHTGVDYAGPVNLKCSKGRGVRSYKGYIAVFVCMATRAVHLDVASDYSSEEFINVFDRFINRRGACATLSSDCGTNFVGAERELRKMFEEAKAQSDEIAHHLADEGTEWRFNPPAAPHFGGLWESAVKSVKYHLKRVVGDTLLTFEEMSTVLSRIEACLNSRPLSRLRDDPTDFAVLTPGHFLVASPTRTVPAPSTAGIPISRLTRYQLLQKMTEDFWSRWSSEYLHELQQRPTWHSTTANVKIGDVCLLRSESLPPAKWPLARITAVKPGKDGLVRVVEVKTATSTFLRPISKITVLPVDDDCSPKIGEGGRNVEDRKRR